MDGYMIIPLDIVSPNKVLISFTWDDNALKHYTTIAPLFEAHKLRCSFYIVPGAHDFKSKYEALYYDLSNRRFDIGSHTFTHPYMTSLPRKAQEKEFTDAAAAIIKLTGIYPLTFAFPHHDYDNDLKEIAYTYHLETRNTLINSKRFSIKTATDLTLLRKAVETAILYKHNLVFSGHSISEGYENEGYEPMRIDLLRDFLNYLEQIKEHVEITTFSNAVLKMWVRNHAGLTDQGWLLSTQTLEKLERYHIDSSNIISRL